MNDTGLQHLQIAQGIHTAPQQTNELKLKLYKGKQKVPTPPHVLVPEIALLSPLPKHQQQRFEKALLIMHSKEGLMLNWQKIANQSGISPAHFHRQFKNLFCETPGQYLSRQQLTRAVIDLLQTPERTITEVAHHCGFSSSQALAKALKRELGQTAKSLRDMANTATPAETTALFNQLSQPSKERSVEQTLAKNMPLSKRWFDTRGMKVLKVKEADWDHLSVQYESQLTRLRMQTPIHQLDKDWSNISIIVGDTLAPENEFDNYLPAGFYLCTKVLIAHTTAYLAALEAMFEKAKEQGYAINYLGQLVENIVDVDPKNGFTFTFQIPLLK